MYSQFWFKKTVDQTIPRPASFEGWLCVWGYLFAQLAMLLLSYFVIKNFILIFILFGNEFLFATLLLAYAMKEKTITT